MYIKVKRAELIPKLDDTMTFTPKETKISQKFKKYLSRMNDVIDGNSKKIPNTLVKIQFH